MPKQVDHDERRREIASAVWRIAASRGLEDVSVRQVAAEAGVSARLVQYYFGTRDELLLKALAILNEDAEARARERVGAAEPGPKAVLRAMLLEMLPLDEARRTRYLVYVAYFVRILHDPRLAETVRGAPPALEGLAEDLLAWGRDIGEVSPALDVRTEAELLINSVDGLQTSIVLGHRTGEAAAALIDAQLDRLFALGG